MGAPSTTPTATATGRTITRRSALRGGGAVLGALIWPARALARAERGRLAVTRVARSKVPVHLVRTSYHPLVGHTFGVEGARNRLRLLAVEDLPHAPEGSAEAFSLIFRGPPGGQALAHSILTLSHPELGSFALFVVPGQQTRAGRHYGAVINRLH